MSETTAIVALVLLALRGGLSMKIRPRGSDRIPVREMVRVAFSGVELLSRRFPAATKPTHRKVRDVWVTRPVGFLGHPDLAQYPTTPAWIALKLLAFAKRAK